MSADPLKASPWLCVWLGSKNPLLGILVMRDTSSSCDPYTTFVFCIAPRIVVGSSIKYGLTGESVSTNLSVFEKLWSRLLPLTTGDGVSVSDLKLIGLMSWSKLSKAKELEEESVESRDPVLSSISTE